MALRLVGGAGENEQFEQGPGQGCPGPKTNDFDRIGRLVVALASALRDADCMSIGSPICSGEEVVRAAPSVGAVSIDEAKARWRDVMTAEGKSIRTIDCYCIRLEELAKHAGWNHIGHVRHEDLMTFLAHRMRGDHGGTPWGNGSCRSAISAIKHFGGFLKSISGTNHFDGMKLPKRRAQKHKHPYSVDEAKRQVLASFTRQQRDARAKGHPALFSAMLFWTGLRHSELQKPCKENVYGGLKWRDLMLDDQQPGIWTDPKWIGNKSKTRDWIPLFPRLATLLRAHRETVMHRPDDPVFPIFMTKPTWVDDRNRASLPSHDPEGRPLSIHATRATYCTWIGKLTLPEGLRDRLGRHHGSLYEWSCGERDKAEMAAAIEQLPDIWPDLGGGGGLEGSNPKSFPQSTKPLDNQTPIGILDQATQYDHPLHKHSDRPSPAGSLLRERASVVPADSRGGRDSVEPVKVPDPPHLTLIRCSGLDQTTARQTLESLNLLIQILAPRGSAEGVSDDDGKHQQPA